MRSTLALLFVMSTVAALPGCGGGGTCGAGTHDDGAGGCAVDNALAIVTTSSAYWACSTFGDIQFLAGGTGLFDFTSRQAITWTETSGTTDSISFAAGGSSFTFTNIVPTTLVGPGSFTAKENGTTPTTCYRVNAQFP